jgi:hypothetical protein
MEAEVRDRSNILTKVTGSGGLIHPGWKRRRMRRKRIVIIIIILHISFMQGIYNYIPGTNGAWGGVVVKALRY